MENHSQVDAEEMLFHFWLPPLNGIVVISLRRLQVEETVQRRTMHFHATLNKCYLLSTEAFLL